MAIPPPLRAFGRPVPDLALPSLDRATRAGRGARAYPAETGMGPRQQVPSLGGAIKWRAA